MSVFVVAEAGVNHNGSLELAHRLIDVAADARADAVKFQSFRADLLVDPSAPKADYQARRGDAGESQHAMLRKLELTRSDHESLIEHARTRSIRFLSTPFDAASLAMLIDLGVDTIKVPSGELTNGPFLLEIARSAHRMIVSTGMSTLHEVAEALGVIAFGVVGSTDAPGPEAFARALASDSARRTLGERVVLLHCTSDYPAAAEDANLRAMATMVEAFGLPVGYSDHTRGTAVSLAAVALGACMIEKHFTLDRTLPGPDHEASLEPQELRKLVAAIRDVEQAIGDGVKRPRPAELGTRAVARKRLVASRAIARGEILDSSNLTARRPADGISPMDFWRVAGSPSPRSYAPGEALDG